MSYEALREVREMEAKAFIPNELKTIEVDVEKRVFKVNGEKFGEGCTGFSISCEADDGYKIRMEVDQTIHFASYELIGGKKKTGYSFKKVE